MSVYRFISAEKARTPVSMCCESLGVSRSGYYDWASRSPSDRALSDAWLLEKIRAIWSANRRVYGVRRIHAELRLAHGVRVGKKRVERLMREAGISGLVRRNGARPRSGSPASASPTTSSSATSWTSPGSVDTGLLGGLGR